MIRIDPRDFVNKDGGGFGEIPKGFIDFESHPENRSQSRGGNEINPSQLLTLRGSYIASNPVSGPLATPAQAYVLAPAPTYAQAPAQAYAPATWTPTLTSTLAYPTPYKVYAPVPATWTQTQAPIAIAIKDPTRYTLIEPQRIHNNAGNEYTWQKDPTNGSYNFSDQGNVIYSAMHVSNISDTSKMLDGESFFTNLSVNGESRAFKGLRLGEFVYFNFTNQDIYVGGIGNRGSLRVPANNPSQVSEIHSQTSPASKITYVNDSESRPQNLALLQSKSDLEARDGAIYEAQRLITENKNLKIAPQRQLESIKKLEHELLFAQREIDRINRQNELEKNESDRRAKNADAEKAFNESKIESSLFRARQEAQAAQAAKDRAAKAAEALRRQLAAAQADAKAAEAATAAAKAQADERVQAEAQAVTEADSLRRQLAAARAAEDRAVTEADSLQRQLAEQAAEARAAQAAEDRAQGDSNQNILTWRDWFDSLSPDEAARVAETARAAARQLVSVQTDPVISMDQWNGSAIQSDQIAKLQRQISDQAARADAAERAAAAEALAAARAAEDRAAEALRREKDQVATLQQQLVAAEEEIAILKGSISSFRVSLENIKTQFEKLKNLFGSEDIKTKPKPNIEYEQGDRENNFKLKWIPSLDELKKKTTGYNIFLKFTAFSDDQSSSEEQQKALSQVALLKLKLIELGKNNDSALFLSHKETIKGYLTEVLGVKTSSNFNLDDEETSEFCQEYFSLGQQYKKILEKEKNKPDSNIKKMMSYEFKKDKICYDNESAQEYLKLNENFFEAEFVSVSSSTFKSISEAHSHSSDKNKDDVKKNDDKIILLNSFILSLEQACIGYKEIKEKSPEQIEISPEVAKVFVALDNVEAKNLWDGLSCEKQIQLKDFLKQELQYSQVEQEGVVGRTKIDIDKYVDKRKKEESSGAISKFCDSIITKQEKQKLKTKFDAPTKEVSDFFEKRKLRCRELLGYQLKEPGALPLLGREEVNSAVEKKSDEFSNFLDLLNDFIRKFNEDCREILRGGEEETLPEPARGLRAGPPAPAPALATAGTPAAPAQAAGAPAAPAATATATATAHAAAPAAPATATATATAPPPTSRQA